MRGGPDYHDPLAGFGGAPPARSALTLRLLLAAFGSTTCAAGAVLLAIFTDAVVLVALLCLGATTALVDIAVIQRRRHGSPMTDAQR